MVALVYFFFDIHLMSLIFPSRIQAKVIEPPFFQHATSLYLFESPHSLINVAASTEVVSESRKELKL
jgi:hypothetical protein